MLNVGCGTRTHPEWNNVDFSPYARLASYPRLARMLRSINVLSQTRYQRFLALDPDIVYWDLLKGIPYPNESFDVVYHSHFLEHLERAAAVEFLSECRRVLRPGGIVRVVIPDLQRLALDYLATVPPNGNPEAHEKSIEEIFEQMVRREARGPSEQVWWVRRIEQRLRVSASQTGELHRWMYDEFSLARRLAQVGFRKTVSHSANTSSVRDWPRFGLDVDPDGSVYKPGSLYLEGLT